MPVFEIREAKAFHAGRMMRLLRVEHHRAVAQLGIDGHRELRDRFDASAFRRIWTIDGRLAALGGVTGSLLDAVGYVWLAMSWDAARYPKQIVREARRQLAAISISKRNLATTILDGDDAAMRFAVFLGFRPATGGAPAQSRQGRRHLTRDAVNDPDLRVPIGKGFSVAMFYQHEAA